MIKCFKLMTGETVISEYQESDDVIDFIKPALVVPVGEFFQFIPFPALSDLTMETFSDCVIPVRSIAYSFVPDKQLIDGYNQTITKIITPSTQIIA